jgi:7,8-dihydropterin-6-yl-methyl-4-(beta-D-ribofuranosyl)aminobenzene 5'-phosphate synthase
LHNGRKVQTVRLARAPCFQPGRFARTEEKDVIIKVIATGSTKEDRAVGNWGLSILLGDDLLFDTHGVSAILKRRLREERVDVFGIRDIVISHDHWDHTNGLWDLLLQNRTVNVHVCTHAAQTLTRNIETFGGFVRPCGGFQSIRDGVVTTGELPAALNGNVLYEQALVLTSAAGLVVVTGCAHPGIVTILEKVRQWSGEKIYLALGGFHLLEAADSEIQRIIDRMKDLGVANVAPTHCTGERATELMRQRFGPHFVEIRNGSNVEIPE